MKLEVIIHTSFAKTSKLDPPMRDDVPTKHLLMTCSAKPTASKICAPWKKPWYTSEFQHRPIYYDATILETTILHWIISESWVGGEQLEVDHYINVMP